MSLSSWLWGSSQLDDAVEKATSELLPAGSEDIALNLEICDQIRSKAAPAKDAMKSLKARLNHKNPNVQLLALGLTDICVKNGGDHFLVEVASREFMDNLTSILKMPTLNVEVKTAILRYIQNWATAFEGKPSLSYVGTVYKSLQSEGFTFPPKDPALANTVMVDTQTAPEWIDSDVCLRCRTPFSFTNRKHHCRNCGQVFDQQCSSKTMALPHFGIAQEVRVCDGCYNKLKKRGDKTHRSSQSMHGSRSRAARDIADAELQRAIQLSLEEVGAAGGHRPGYVPAQPSNWQSSEPPLVDRSTRNPGAFTEEDDPDLRAAIEASLRESNAPKPSAPIAMDSPQPVFSEHPGPGFSQSYPSSSHLTSPTLPRIPNHDLEPLESDAILTFSQTVEQVHAQGGRDIARYPAVGELYNKANSLRPKLALSMDDTGRKEQVLSEMHDKLSQAVKLYDSLLTRNPAQPPYQPQANGHYDPSYAPPSAYGPWSPAPAPEVSQQYAQPPPQQYAQPPPQWQQQAAYSPQQSTYQPLSSPSIQPSYEQTQVASNPVPSAPAGMDPARNVTPTPMSPVLAGQGTQLQRSQTHSAAASSRASPLAGMPQRTNTYAARPVARANEGVPAPSNVQLPAFPVAPTSAPQTFSLYAPSCLDEPRKEAALIDL
ncbi:hypothetical protein BD626DRAFT_497163 [Schizophyllum amplum]|uniref:Vacuolar protein sorting-associated protein 27 n=1 Tax=Schizophyllum amplum TaxID=97359 RepID=A0A550CDS6_9AGAR|nr:hypothetical protein BD626DRAFT_497163 [Auriculariopsis ampla]